jgi:predicted short-subunit dehydrogenase-like oxidoreductase (DUF2520 family)
LQHKTIMSRKRDISSITIIGAGRVARGIGLALKKEGIPVRQVWNRSIEKGNALAGQLCAEYIQNFEEIRLDCDLCILAVSDDALAEISAQLPHRKALVVHTSGMVPMGLIQRDKYRCGVFYPLQTFGGATPPDFSTIPVCIEAEDPVDLELLRSMAGKLTRQVHVIDSDSRARLHLAAVFANNFAHFMFVLGAEIAKSAELPGELLVPLIRRTGEQISDTTDLFKTQTGPAVRGDLKVIGDHRKLLGSRPDLLEIYNLITQNIIQFKEKNGQL